MPRPQNMSVDSKNGSKRSNVRKRGCSSPSSSSSLLQNHRLKRVFLVGKKGGSTTPVPMWKMMSSGNSDSPLLENDKFVAGKNGEMGHHLSVSARKLAAVLWEINGLSLHGVKGEILEDKISEVGKFGKETERMDQVKFGSHRRRAIAGSQKLLQADCSLFVQVDQTQNRCRHITGLENHLKNVHNGLTTSKLLLKALIHVCDLDRLNPTSLSLVSALKIELNRTYTRVNKLFQTKRSENDVQLSHFEDKKVVSKELEIEKKLRRKTEKQNEKLGRELEETKASLLRANKELEREKKARQIMEHVCDELARGVGDDKAEVEEIKRKSEKVCQEMEKEREMFRLADVLREERVQMKLSEARYHFEEKNALVEKLRSELEAYLKFKNGEENGNFKDIENYLRENFVGSSRNEDNKIKDVGVVNKEDNEEEEDGSDDSDLRSIELNVDDVSKSFRWGDGVKHGSQRNSIDKSKGGKKQENADVFGSKDLSEFTAHSLKNSEDEMERYNMIKDLRDHIVSCSKIASSQELAS